MNFISFENNGPTLIASNYWDSDYAKRGFLFLTTNAGAYRLLVPDLQLNCVQDMLTAKEVILTYGFSKSDSQHMVEILFDDHTNFPFVLNLSINQLDKGITKAGDGGRDFLIYGSGCQHLGKLTAYYREDKLPCMRPLV